MGARVDKQSAVVGIVAAIAIAGWQLSKKPTDFSAQYITLPSGKRAYCNRQGYREISRTYTYEENILVRDTDGDFVKCDARVGPEWDDTRADENGNLLTPEQVAMRQAERQREQQAKNQAEAAEHAKSEAQERAAKFAAIDRDAEIMRRCGLTWYKAGEVKLCDAARPLAGPGDVFENAFTAEDERASIEAQLKKAGLLP